MASLSFTLLAHLSKGHSSSIDSLAQAVHVSPDAIRRVVGELEPQGLVEVHREKHTVFELTPTGIHAQSHGLPEQILCRALMEKSLSMNDSKKLFSHDAGAFSAALGLAKRSNWIEVKNENNQTLLSITPLGKKSVEHSPLHSLLTALSRGEAVDSASPVVSELVSRGLLQSKTRSEESLKITE